MPVARILMLAAVAALAATSDADLRSAGGAAPVYHYSTEGPAVPILTEQNMQAFGIFYPDMPIGVARAPNGNLLVFSAGASFGRFGPGKNIVPQGTYKFVGTLDHITPAKTNGRWPAPSLMDGVRQPSPDGSDFDRDYAGGGPTYVERDPRWGNAPLLLQVYHGEYHENGTSLPFYGASGLAISNDNGDTFTKIGEILSPHISRHEFFGRRPTGGVTADASLVEADANGHPVAPNSGPAGVYVYAIFSDREDYPSRQGIAIARIAKSDLLDAIATKTAPHFTKFGSASATPGSVAGNLTEPGVGGRSSLIVGENAYLATPNVAYDADLRKFVLCYQKNQKEIVLRTADNLLQWSAPTTIVSIPANSDVRVFYPTLVGVGKDPAVLGAAFDVFYLQRVMPGNRDVSFQRLAVKPLRLDRGRARLNAGLLPLSPPLSSPLSIAADVSFSLENSGTGF